ncbi:hypothetical protein L9F63_017739, partial [Diploptera punctata]
TSDGSLDNYQQKKKLTIVKTADDVYKLGESSEMICNVSYILKLFLVFFNNFFQTHKQRCIRHMTEVTFLFKSKFIAREFLHNNDFCGERSKFSPILSNFSSLQDRGLSIWKELTSHLVEQ